MRTRTTDTEPASTELHLANEHQEELARLAAAGYPHEVCGLLIGRAADEKIEIEKVTEARNLNRERAGDRYELDPRDFLAADRAARESGLEILGIWHTHPDCPARPSTTDLKAAWEGYSYLILGVTGRGEADFHSWRLAGSGLFLEETILPQPPPTEAPELRFERPLKEEQNP